MKGIVFNLLQDAVEQEHGETAWDIILEKSGLDGAYTSLGSYADEDLQRLVAAASAELSVPPDVVIRWFGRRALAALAKRYPIFFTGHTSAKPFILTLNDIIHPEVRKVYPGADAPSFDFKELPDNILEMGYQSKRRLCGFAHGLLEGSIEYYKDEAKVTHPNCTLRGDPTCVFAVAFQRDTARS